jgi:hypothetical protein
MKSLLFALCLFLATTAFGQAIGHSSVGNQAHMRAIPGHPLHAGFESMAPEVSLLVGSGHVSARGANPLWAVGQVPDAAPVPAAMPLGDVARRLREQHATAKKATIVFEK